MVLINGTEDEIIGSRDFTGLRSGIKVVEIKTGHNFEGTGRGELIAAITREVK